MELKQLVSFIAIVECGSFTSAAEKLQISQPTVTTHVRMLEEELSCNLLSRNTRSLQTTTKGEDLYRTAKEILQLKDNLLKKWDRDDAVIRVGSSTIPTLYILPKLISKCKTEKPDIRFEIIQGDSEQILNKVKNDLCDVGLIGTEVEDKDIRCQVICTDRVVLICPNTKEYQNIPAGKEAILYLLNKPFIMREDGSASQKTANRILEDYGLTSDKMNVLAKVNDQETILKMVSGGMGVAIVSEHAIEESLQGKAVQVLELDTQKAERKICIIERKRGKSTENIETFIKTAKNI